jgi:hypothetical protein
MRSYPESAYRQQDNEYGAYGAQDYLQPQRRGSTKIQIAIAILGLVSFGWMLWTIAKMLGVIPG